MEEGTWEWVLRRGSLQVRCPLGCHSTKGPCTQGLAPGKLAIMWLPGLQDLADKVLFARREVWGF